MPDPADDIETRARELHRLHCIRHGIYDVIKIADYWEAVDQASYRKRAANETKVA